MGGSAGMSIRVGHTANAGRGVFAVRDIGHGELIHTADPVVAHPSLTSLHKVLVLVSSVSVERRACNVAFLPIILQFERALMSLCVCRRVTSV